MPNSLAINRTFVTRATRHKVSIPCVVKLFGSGPMDEIWFKTVDISQSGLGVITEKDIIPYNTSSIIEVHIPDWHLNLVAKYIKQERTINGIFMALRIIDDSQVDALIEHLNKLENQDEGGYFAEEPVSR